MSNQTNYKDLIIDQFEYFIESGVIYFNHFAEKNNFFVKTNGKSNWFQSSSYFPPLIHEIFTTSGVAVASTYGSSAAIAFLSVHIGSYLVNYLVDKYDEKKSYNDSKNIEKFLKIYEFDPLHPWNPAWTRKLVNIFSEIFVIYNTQVIIFH